MAICSSVGEEVLQQSELRNLLEKKKGGIVAYDGFEPSGRMHIAQVIYFLRSTESSHHFNSEILDVGCKLNNFSQIIMPLCNLD